MALSALDYRPQRLGEREEESISPWIGQQLQAAPMLPDPAESCPGFEKHVKMVHGRIADSHGNGGLHTQPTDLLGFSRRRRGDRCGDGLALLLCRDGRWQILVREALRGPGRA